MAGAGSITTQAGPANGSAGARSEAEFSDLGALSGDGQTDEAVPTYTVILHGALLPPFDDRGNTWDGVLVATDEGLAERSAVEVDYEASIEYAQTASEQFDGPEVYGDARISLVGESEVGIELNDAGTGNAFYPQWTASGWKHVRLEDSLRVLISLYDEDATTPDAISYILLGPDDLAGAAAVDGPAALAVYGRTGSRALWLEVEVMEEDPGSAVYATSGLDEDDYEREAPVIADTPRTLWIHGLDFDGGGDVVLPWGDPYYWTKDDVVPTGPSPKVVNYHARAYLNVSNVVLEYALDRHCTTEQACILACHSAGCAQVGYALAEWNPDGTRWNVRRVVGGGSAAGGSELASIAGFFGVDGIAGFLGYDLAVGRMRELYEHDDLGVPVDLTVGAAGGLKAATLPGEDDGSVAYHSAGGARSAVSYCNTAGLTCAGVLPVRVLDEALFFDHMVVFRDDSATYNHTKIKEKISEWVDSEFSSP